MNQPEPTPNSTPAGGFDLNHPTIIALCYIGSLITGGVTGLVGLILAFVWKGETHGDWESSHYQYLINTFWIGLAGSIIGVILTIVLIGIFILMAVAALVIVRCVLSLINAQKRIPMPNPGSWVI
ncbi:MAG: hypothetical protein ABL909_03615 [Sphingopyxis sp.]